MRRHEHQHIHEEAKERGGQKGAATGTQGLAQIGRFVRKRCCWGGQARLRHGCGAFVEQWVLAGQISNVTTRMTTLGARRLARADNTSFYRTVQAMWPGPCVPTRGRSGSHTRAVAFVVKTTDLRSILQAPELIAVPWVLTG